MTTLICNTLTGAVSEYDWPAFHAITPTHVGSASGLFELTGDTDAGLPIVAEIRTPRALRTSSLKKFPDLVWVSIKGQGCMNLSVHGEQRHWGYSFTLRPTGETRCPVGRGIRENYVGFGLKNPQGQAFALDRIEVRAGESKTRRV